MDNQRALQLELVKLQQVRKDLDRSLGRSVCKGHTGYQSGYLELVVVSHTHESELAVIATGLNVGDACNRDTLYRGSQVGHKLPARHVGRSRGVRPGTEASGRSRRLWVRESALSGLSRVENW